MNYFDNELLEEYLNLFGFDLYKNPSKVEIKSAYRKLMAKNHPDKVSSLGKEIQELANKKTQVLNEAFDYIEKNYEPQKVYEKTEKIEFEDTYNYKKTVNVEDDSSAESFLTHWIFIGLLAYIIGNFLISLFK